VHKKLLIRPVRLRQWGEEYLVYNELTADTHLLDAVSGGLIFEMSKKELSTQELLQFFLLKNQGVSEKDVKQYLDSVLVKFQEMELIETGL